MSDSRLSSSTDKEIFLEFVRRIPRPSEEALEGMEFLEISEPKVAFTEIKVNIDPPSGEYLLVLFNPDGAIMELETACY